uniref:Uncharacterized protein n=1 Tax=Anguilla anguilla TaxID=7936 RepID=A0A0E9QAC4_ANGAN
MPLVWHFPPYGTGEVNYLKKYPKVLYIFNKSKITKVTKCTFMVWSVSSAVLEVFAENRDYDS